VLAEKVVQRRHLFDNGYPVTNATLIAGSHVVLALARHSQRTSKSQLARSFLLLADSSGRLLHSLARYGRSHAELRETRDNHLCIGSDRQPGEAAAASPVAASACRSPETPSR